MPIEADYNEEEGQFGKNPENDFFGKDFEAGGKSPEMSGNTESFEKSPINDMQGIFGNSAMGVLDGKHASMDELNSAGSPDYDMPPPEAELPRPAMDFGGPEAATSEAGSSSPAEDFGQYNTLEK